MFMTANTFLFMLMIAWCAQVGTWSGADEHVETFSYETQSYWQAERW